MDSLDVIIPTCDKYMPIVEANLCGINHFWEKVGKVIIIGYNSPEFKLPEGVEFVSMGEDRTPSEWSDGILSFFESYDKDKFILHMDDHCIVDYVDQDSIEKIKMIMDFDKKIDKIMLHPFKVDIPLKTYNHKFEGLDLFICEKGYGSTTLMPAVWRTSYILSILAKGLNPHSFENQSNTTKIKKLYIINL